MPAYGVFRPPSVAISRLLGQGTVERVSSFDDRGGIVFIQAMVDPVETECARGVARYILADLYNPNDSKAERHHLFRICDGIGLIYGAFPVSGTCKAYTVMRFHRRVPRWLVYLVHPVTDHCVVEGCIYKAVLDKAMKQWDRLDSKGAIGRYLNSPYHGYDPTLLDELWMAMPKK